MGPYDIGDLPQGRGNDGHHGPAWGRADGGAVIVFRWEEGHGAYGGSLYTIREDGTGLTLLSESVGDARDLGGYRLAFDTSPAVSPDGTRVAYSTLRHSEAGEFGIAMAALQSKRGTLFSRGGRERQQLTKDAASDTEPSWSPDGTRIAFLRDGRLHTMAADGSDVRSISEVVAVSEPSAWSPDGTRLAFVGRLNGRLYVKGTDASYVTGVAEDQSGRHIRVGRPVWSPDGRRIAFVGSSDVVPPILFVLDVDQGTVETLVEGGLAPLWWSPDGDEIIACCRSTVTQNGGNSGSNRRGLHSVDLASGAVTQLMSGAGLNPHSADTVRGRASSPDGSRVAVLTYLGAGLGAQHVVLLTAAPDGSDVRVLVRLGPDGELVAEGAGQGAGSSLRDRVRRFEGPIVLVVAVGLLLLLLLRVARVTRRSGR